MKNFFIYLAIFTVLIFCIVCFTDFGTTEIRVLQFNQDISSACENASAMIDSDSFGEGYYIFNDSDVIEQVKLAIRDKADSKIEILDKSGYRAYETDADGEFKSAGTKTCSFPYPYTNVKGKTIQIEHPAIIITSTISGTFYKVFREEQSYCRQVMYEVVGYADI